MPLDQLKREIGEGVAFWGCESGGALVGMMGIQDRGEVSLIRHGLRADRAASQRHRREAAEAP